MNVKRALLRLLPWLVLWGAFVAFGLWVRSVQPWSPEGTGYRVVELYGMDYRRYSQMLGGWQMILYACFRHPLYGLLMTPVIGVGSHFRTLGEGPFWGWLVVFFSGVMTLAHFLVYWLLRRHGLDRLASAALTALFASFAASWLLAACPESFNLSCLLALLTLHFALYVRRHAATMDRTLERAGWGALAVVTGGITSTQVVKTALAYFVTRRPKWRHVLFVGLAILVAALLVGAAFALRLYLRAEPGAYAREFAGALRNISAYAPQAGMGLSRRLACAFVFFTEPFLTRGAPFCIGTLPPSYASPSLAALALLPVSLAAFAAGCARRDFVARLVAAMLLVDVAIHFVLFWGMEEAQIYAGHWYHAVPIFIGTALLRLSPRPRRLASLLLLALAATLLPLNLAAWLHQ